MRACFRLIAAVAIVALLATRPAQARRMPRLSPSRRRAAPSRRSFSSSPRNRSLSVILFAGGHGALGLRSASSMKWGKGNFLVRTRDKFAAHNLMVAVVDAPSDRQKGMNAIFRMSGAHGGDIGAVAAYLKKQAAVPVWVVGTSMGTFSAAEGAIAARNVDGLVLTSTITRAKPQWNIARSHRHGVASMPLQKVTVPALIVSHTKDGCDITPAADAPKLRKGLANAKPVDVVLLSGGAPPRSDPCEAMSQHGFLGIEARPSTPSPSS